MLKRLFDRLLRGMNRTRFLAVVCLVGNLVGIEVHAQSGAATGSEAPAAASGPVRLQQAPVQRVEEVRAKPELMREDDRPTAPAPLGDFERFIKRQTGVAIKRFGADLLMASQDGAADTSPLVPPDYPVAPGDEVLVTIWGSVDADLRLVVDRTGRINIPRVGSIVVSGVRQAELPDTISRRVAQVFKNFQLSVSLGSLRGIRVFVTGFVTKPGAYQVTSLSTLSTALFKAGGPSSAGSFRRIELRRGAQSVQSFDLYDFMLKGDRSGDRLLQSGDVVHVLPVGPEVALIGSVNRPAIVELKAGETVADVLRMGGGFTAVADRKRLAVERLSDRNDTRIRELSLPMDLSAVLDQGDTLRAFSAVDAMLPVQKQNKRVRVEGEVARPGDYVMPASSTIADALDAAGGFTAAAYLFGTEFMRESVKVGQQENYERALRDLETEFARQGTQRAATADDATAGAARVAANTRLIDRLRAARPTGRIVLQVNPGTNELPALALEDGDRIYIPPKPSTVGVFGSVFNTGSFLHSASRTIDEYLRLAGGPTRGADQDSTFVVRANGSVISNLQGTGRWFQRGTALANASAEPGDTIFVPEEINKSTFVQSAKDWTQILYQFGLGVAGLKAVGF